jgi:TolB-like protein/class 3 adenylate cyclase/Flp pilus assembly protein TadD
MDDDSASAPTTTESDNFYIAGWRIHSSLNRISRGDESVRLEPRAMATLACLVEQAGEVVTREKLEARVWPSMVIGNDVLSNVITKLRKAFGDDTKKPRYIETVPKVGYRLIAEVSRIPVPLEPRSLERKLAAIMYTDVAGYSRLTEADEEGTHQILSSYLDAMSSAIAHHNGQVVHYAGDAILAEFPTVVDALSCGLDMQRDMDARNQQLPAESLIQFRIGINLGDVIADRDDIYGEGVNVAARLESLADPGGICVSESVRTAIGNKLPASFEFMGEQRVKNISVPLRTYRVLPEGQVSRHWPLRRIRPGIAAVVVATGAILGSLWWYLPRPTIETGTVAALPLPDKPSIAVLPFSNLSDDPQQDYFTDGITDDVITDLSKVSGLFVIGRNTMFRYKGRSTDFARLVKELGVRHVLEGSVQKAGNSVRINVKLIEGDTGANVWAERYNGTLDDVFALQDKITQRIVSALAVRLTVVEELRIAHTDTVNKAAYDAFLLGRSYYNLGTPDDFRKATTYFQQAVANDPEFARAYAYLASIYWEAWKRSWHLTLGVSPALRAWGLARDHLTTSLEKHPSPRAYQVASEMAFHNRRYDEALREAKRARELDPNDPLGHLALSNVLVFTGSPAPALEQVDQAMRRDPQTRATYLLTRGHALFGTEQYQQAMTTLEEAVHENPSDRRAYTVLIATYGHLGMLEKAKAAIAKVKALHLEIGFAPLSVSLLKTPPVHWPYRQRPDFDRLLDGLRKAGVPEW